MRLRVSSSSRPAVCGFMATRAPVASAPTHDANSVLPEPWTGASNPKAGAVGNAGRSMAVSSAANNAALSSGAANGKSWNGCMSVASACRACSMLGLSGMCTLSRWVRNSLLSAS